MGSPRAKDMVVPARGDRRAGAIPVTAGRARPQAAPPVRAAADIRHREVVEGILLAKAAVADRPDRAVADVRHNPIRRARPSRTVPTVREAAGRRTSVPYRDHGGAIRPVTTIGVGTRGSFCRRSS